MSIFTRSDLGTSPISAILYVLSLHDPFTPGAFTIAFSLLLVLLQAILLPGCGALAVDLLARLIGHKPARVDLRLFGGMH